MPNKSIDSQHYKRLRRNRIPFTLTFHPHNHAVKSIILKNFKLLQNDSETGTIFSQPQTNDQSGTFKCARSRCKTCPFIHNVEKILGPKRSIKIIDHFSSILSTKMNSCGKQANLSSTGLRLDYLFTDQTTEQK